MSAIDRNLEQEQQFQATPRYIMHKAEEDCMAILVSQIKIWSAKGVDWNTVPKADECLTIRECQSIEITESAKELIGSAVLKFPRGTVIHKTSNKGKNVVSGTLEDGTERTSQLQDATNDGEFITPQTSTFSEDGVSTTPLAVHYDDKGLLAYNRSVQDVSLLQPGDIAIGNRIEIRLGYAYSEAEFKEMNNSDGVKMDVAFTGFITSVSVDTPLEIECKNLAHVLTTFNVPNIIVKGSLSVKTFLDEGSKYDLLKDTGIQLAESSKNSEIFVNGGSISNNLSVADVLTEWNKSGVLCFMETDRNTGISKLRVGLTYFAGKGGNKMPNDDKKYVTYNGGNSSVKIIQFDWDVANDKLDLVHNDKKYLAVEASGWTSNNTMIKFTLIKSPDKDDDGWIIDDSGNNNFEGQFRQVNTRVTKTEKKTTKHKKGTKSTVKTEHMSNKVKVDKYNVVHYQSTKIGITEAQLMEEAKQFWAQCVPNGISGSIEIFGDMYVKPTEIVGLIDPRRPEKNGYYYVESVTTTFGIDGYRRELKFPYKIASFSQQIKYIE